jgi:predicted ABC-type ATPase
MPNLFVIAGPNGAGKSTSAPELLSGVRRVAEFVNADVIQKEEAVSEIQAGRRTLQRLSTLADARMDMAFETTLASHLLLPRIRRMQASGYVFHLFFFWLASADMAVKWVAARVASGIFSTTTPASRTPGFSTTTRWLLRGPSPRATLAMS